MQEVLFLEFACMLPSSFRLSKKDPQLTEAFRNGKKYSLGSFGYVRFLRTEEPLRVLCLVGRFFDNRAVVRNTFRRRVYAAILAANTTELRGVLIFHAPKKEVQ